MRPLISNKTIICNNKDDYICVATKECQKFKTSDRFVYIKKQENSPLFSSHLFTCISILSASYAQLYLQKH